MEREEGRREADDLEHRTPRWVKLFALIAAILVVLLVFAIAFGDGAHGPGRHTPTRQSVPEEGVAPALAKTGPLVDLDARPSGRAGG